MTQDQSADKSDSPVWSGSDFPYVCLKDRGRTLELMAAVTDLVRPGDVVLDLGSGSGILSLAAARAGASEVIAVELDSLMARTLRQTVSANGYEDI
ncbi:MAG: 50S ribosomal protein L11 methyltransferase, partial [Microthrixaceae bacterium]|nr:50S ribosomal protein L11 methyltransferase [Microthrixaceae bacterium]